jgi:SNF2 family DNA or RNA helicase
MNNAIDIYGVMKSINRDLGNYQLFVDRYCRKDVWGSIKYYTNMDELKARIEPWIVSCTLEQAQFDLPRRTDTNLEFELSAAESSLYTRIKSELLFEIEQAEVSKLSSPMILQNSLVKLGKLQELTDSCELIGESTESSKLAILKEHLENNLYDGQKAIIFTRFSRMAEILDKALRQHNPQILTGNTSNRQEVIDRFTQDKNCKVFISTEAGGAGINLQAANIVYNYDLPFSLGKLEQRNGRIRWHLQYRPCFFYNLIAKVNGHKSIDHWVLDKLEKKQEISQLLLSDIKQLLQ